MRLDEITKMDHLTGFVDSFFKEHLPKSMGQKSAEVVFLDLTELIWKFQTAVNKWLKSNDHHLEVDVTLIPSKGFNGAVFKPAKHVAQGNKIVHGLIDIKFPNTLHGEAYDHYHSAVFDYLVNVLSHEIGHGLQTNNTNGYAAYRSAEAQLLRKGTEPEYFKYLTSHLETEMQGFSSAYELLALAKHNEISVADLLKMAITDRNQFLTYLNRPGLISLHTMFKTYYEFPESPAKTQGLKRFLKKFYHYVISIQRHRDSQTNG